MINYWWLLVVAIAWFAFGSTIPSPVFHRHTWSPWGFVKDRAYFDEFSGNIPTKRTKVYARVCTKCNYPQTMEVKN